MNTTHLQFLCSKCEQLLECEAEYAGQDTACPFCQQIIRIPIQTPPLAPAKEQPDTTSRPALRFRSRLVRVAFSVIIGAGLLGFLTGLGPIGALLGALVGLLVGWRITEIQSRYGGNAGVAKSHFPAAPLGLILATGSWLLATLVWHWVATRPPGTFNDQGGMVITFGVLPLYFGSWLMGGPVALALAHLGTKQIQSGARPMSERWMARTGVALSRIMMFTGIGLVAWGLLREFSR